MLYFVVPKTLTSVYAQITMIWNNEVQHMKSQPYTATKTRSSRPGWSVTFKHPKRSDSRGRPGLKVRKGLGTKEEAEADRLVLELNELLSDEHWWAIDRRKEAELRFDSVVVNAFFDGMESGKISSTELRDKRLPLPGSEEGYSRILLTGTTGAGKTTLLRHIIGSSHREDRFPSTSAARTTTSEIEIITSSGAFEAAVTFMPEHEVRAHVDECLEEACIRRVQGQSDDKAMGALLSHREQRFRLSYVLGGWNQKVAEAPEDEFSFNDDEPQIEILADDETLSPEEVSSNHERLNNYLSKIDEITDAANIETAESLGSLNDQENPDDKASWLEIFGETLYEQEGFSRLALDIMEEVENRFSAVKEGDFEKSPSGWPIIWHYQSEERESFVRQLRWFASNHHAQFGKLLTPLVDGVRARGPFHPIPEALRVAPKLVLLDGEGIGHSAKAVSSVSTRITRRFSQTDLILIVDNAEQPMQTAPLELLRSIGSSGYADKLAIAFTHFDLVKGPNLGSHALKCEHVLNSVHDAIGTLRQSIGAPVANLLEKRIESCAYYLGGLDREIDKIPTGFTKQIGELLEEMQKSGAPAEQVSLKPIYSGEGLEISLRDAVEGFQQPWKARLGLSYHDGIPKEHWTRVKALTRRFAMAWSNEYDDMRPVADLVARLQESISRWLDNPASWNREPIDDDECTAALSGIRKEVFTALHELAEERLADLHRSNWTKAYDYSGRGSSYERAGEIEHIYEDAAPLITSAMNEPARNFLHALHRLVQDAVEDSGGEFKLTTRAA